MNTQDRRYRVTIDFPEVERKALTALCAADFRPPDDQLRYLLVNEAKRRGLLHDPPNCQQLSTKNEGHAVTLDKSGAPFCVQP